MKIKHRFWPGTISDFGVLAITLFAGWLAIAAAPVAPPTGHDADWNAGWTARDTYVAPTTQPTPATQPTTAPVIVWQSPAPTALGIPSGMAESKITIARSMSLRGGKIIHAVDAAHTITFDVKSSLAWDSVSFDSNGPKVVPGVIPDKVNGVSCQIFAPGFSATNCTWDNLDSAVYAGIGTNGATLTDCTFGAGMRGDSFFGGGQAESDAESYIVRGNVTFLRCHFLASAREHNVRISTPGFYGLTCTQCDFSNLDGKECVGIRRGRHFLFDRCKFTGAGQMLAIGDGRLLAPPPGAPKGSLDVDDFTLLNCEYHGPIQINYASNVHVIGGTSYIDASKGDTSEPVALNNGNGTGVTCQGLKVIVTVKKPGQATKPIWRGTVADGGGNTTVTVLATQPAK